jgi:hypothetical protein
MKSKKSKVRKAIKPLSSFKNKLNEIDVFAQPMGDDNNTNVLDFHDMNQIPADKRKKLQMTNADQEYFSGAKRDLFGKNKHKVRFF